MLPEIPSEEVSRTLDEVVMAILAEGRVERPPVDAFALAAALGLTVALDDQQAGRARYVRLSRGRGPSAARGTILLKPELRPERRHWAIAHEIGEHTVWRVFAALGVDPRETGPDARETTANHLANRLLLPGDWFGVDAKRCGWDLADLKRRYATASHELIARRMLDFAPPVIITIFDQGRVSLRRSNVWGRIPAPSATEMQCWRAAHRGNQPQQLQAESCVTRSWPVHEPGWKREILRTELMEG